MQISEVGTTLAPIFELDPKVFSGNIYFINVKI
jgi:hypothetical protein